jgi:hypothetical protein
MATRIEEKPEIKQEEKIAVVERVINLELINEKLNYIISQLAEKKN